MAELTYRDAVARGIAQEMRARRARGVPRRGRRGRGRRVQDDRRPARRVRPERVRDTPISEQAILGAAMGAAMTGLRPIAEIMFSDFLAVCWDIVANEIAKSRYMTNGQVSLAARDPHGQRRRRRASARSIRRAWRTGRWRCPVSRSSRPRRPADVKGLLAAAVRDPDPVIVLRAEVAVRDEGRGARRRDRRPARQGQGRPRRARTCTIVALAAMVPTGARGRRALEQDGIDAT